MVEAERLTFAFAEAADAAARISRTTSKRWPHSATERVSRAWKCATPERPVLLDHCTRDVNATGSHAPAMMALFGDPQPVPMLKAMNLVTTVPASDIALAARSAAGRMLTLVPGGAAR